MALPIATVRSFKRSMANKIMLEVIEQKMEFYNVNERDPKKNRLTYTFNSDEANVIISEIVEECQKRVIAAMRADNNDQPPRYKLVFQATFGENSGQMVRCASRCLWDADNDNCASASWSNVRAPNPPIRRVERSDAHAHVAELITWPLLALALSHVRPLCVAGSCVRRRDVLCALLRVSARFCPASSGRLPDISPAAAMVGLDATIIGVRRGVVMHVDLRACVPESMLCVSRGCMHSSVARVPCAAGWCEGSAVWARSMAQLLLLRRRGSGAAWPWAALQHIARWYSRQCNSGQ